MVGELIRILSQQIGYKSDGIYCSAPTNKAVAVLKSKVDNTDTVMFLTTHSALKLKRNVNFKTGKVTFRPSFSEKYPPLKGCKYLVIDETSMLNSDLMNSIEEHAEKQNVKVIFIGDDKQLNPVGEDVSPVFVQGYPEIELTEIVRQKGNNPIIDLSRALDKINSKVESRNEIGGYVYSHDMEKIITTLALANGTDELKYLAYTNKEVDKVNKEVREKIYGTPARVEVGETMIFNAPIGEYFTNEEILVTSAEVKTKEFPFMIERGSLGNDDVFDTITLKYYSINPNVSTDWETGERTFIDNIRFIHEDSLVEFNKLVFRVKALATAGAISWVECLTFVESFADLTYNHAITIHKSQGSTYTKTILNIKNININQNTTERKRLLYTGVTRASELLILYNV